MQPVIQINQGDNKWNIRHKVWDYIENKNLANFPRPVHNRIPNFKGALEACSVVSHLEAFTKTTAVKVDPDKPLEGVRLAALQARKTLLVPTPRLKTGLFNKIVPPKGATKQVLHVCSTSQGIKEFSVPVGLEDSVQVNLVVVGSVAVSENGYRIGKGEGFADMEYAMMACMGAVCDSTVIVTIVHDCQNNNLQEACQSKIQHELKWEPNFDPKSKQPQQGHLTSADDKRARFKDKFHICPSSTIYLGDIPARLRVSELKNLLKEQEAVPLRINWQGAQHRAFLHYADSARVEHALQALKNITVHGNTLRAEYVKSQNTKENEGIKIKGFQGV
ncbi:putative methenyltetrahydrofolate synthase domain-containing protein-like [Triplophysa rosa]|uniref:Methenyltetrahydrofolate synthase domain-containing protein n=1 Tax=Triplophysa rosa TaxID=992332 RepID=A0A9W7TV52_TRIRA|nr:putative methenyltetrahydrofolate synthase domain-containing protein-like [Triplophysa rosa]